MSGGSDKENLQRVLGNLLGLDDGDDSGADMLEHLLAIESRQVSCGACCCVDP